MPHTHPLPASVSVADRLILVHAALFFSLIQLLELDQGKRKFKKNKINHLNQGLGLMPYM